MSTMVTESLRYHRVREDIAEWIAGNKFGPEGRLPPERVLAEQFKMNRRTVRRALADLVAEGMLYKQPRAGCFVRPVRHSAVRRVRAERQGLVISVPLSRTFDEFLNEPAGIARDYLRGIADAARENGATVEFQFVPRQRHAAYMLDLVEQDPPHGIILYDAGNPHLRHVIKRVVERKIPYIAFQPENSLSWEKIRKLGLNYVTTDQQGGLHQMIMHLVGLGHQRIAYWEQKETASPRQAGFRQAMKEAGLELDESLVERHFDFNTPCVTALRSLIERGVTALATASDYIAMKAISDARSSGIDIPNDLSVTGFDDNPAAATTSPPLTTIAVDRFETGRQMALALVEQHRHPGKDKEYQFNMPARLVVRQSTREINHSDLMDPTARCGGH